MRIPTGSPKKSPILGGDIPEEDAAAPPAENGGEKMTVQEACAELKDLAEEIREDNPELASRIDSIEAGLRASYPEKKKATGPKSDQDSTDDFLDSISEETPRYRG